MLRERVHAAVARMAWPRAIGEPEFFVLPQQKIIRKAERLRKAAFIAHATIKKMGILFWGK